MRTTTCNALILNKLERALIKAHRKVKIKKELSCDNKVAINNMTTDHSSHIIEGRFI